MANTSLNDNMKLHLVINSINYNEDLSYFLYIILVESLNSLFFKLFFLKYYLIERFEFCNARARVVLHSFAIDL